MYQMNVKHRTFLC